MVSIKDFLKRRLKWENLPRFLRINNRYWQLWKLNDVVFRVKIWFHVIFLDRMYPNNPSKKFFNGKKRNYIKLTPHLQRNSLGKKVEAYHKKEWKSSPPPCILSPLLEKTEGFWGQPHRVLCSREQNWFFDNYSTIIYDAGTKRALIGNRKEVFRSFSCALPIIFPQNLTNHSCRYLWKKSVPHSVEILVFSYHSDFTWNQNWPRAFKV